MKMVGLKLDRPAIMDAMTLLADNETEKFLNRSRGAGYQTVF